MDVISLQWDNDNDKAWDVVVRQLARDQLRLKQLEAENAELRGRLFSLTCKECGDNLKSLYCPSCGRPMAQVVGQEYPSYAALRERVVELELQVSLLTSNSVEYIITGSDQTSAPLMTEEECSAILSGDVDMLDPTPEAGEVP